MRANVLKRAVALVLDAAVKRKCDFEGKMSELIWFTLERKGGR